MRFRGTFNMSFTHEEKIVIGRLAKCGGGGDERMAYAAAWRQRHNDTDRDK